MHIHILDSSKGSLFLSNGAHIQIPDEILVSSLQKAATDIKAWAVQNNLMSNADSVAFNIV